MRNVVSYFAVLTGALCSPLALSAAGPINSVTNDLPPQGMAARPEKDPLRTLDDLMALTERSLNDQKQLRRQLVEYYKVKARYLQDPQNKDNIVQMIKAAHQVQQIIEAQHLAYVFDSELLDELKFFSQIASKKGMTRP